MEGSSPGLEFAVEAAGRGVSTQGLHPAEEDGESGERTSRSMPVLAPGFVSRLQPPINATHSLRRDSAQLSISAAHPYTSSATKRAMVSSNTRRFLRNKTSGIFESSVALTFLPRERKRVCQKKIRFSRFEKCFRNEISEEIHFYQCLSPHPV